ncbi:hypothetical protein V6N13_068287 [Hibiscus sabdariffa]
MVSSGSVEAASKSPGSRGFDLGEFPHWGRVKLSLQFFPPVTTNGRARVQPPKEVLSNGAKQWDNALVRDWVLESGPWHIQQKAIVLRRWMPGLKFDVLQLDSTPVWVKLWHVPLELFSQQGLGYVASAIGKPLYIDRATALKQQLEFAKICTEVGAKETIPNSVLVELDEDLTVEIVVELEKVVEDGVAKVDSGPENNCDGRVNNGDAKEGLSCDDDGSLGVNSHVSSMVEMSSPNEGIPCVISGESLESPNKFEILCSVVEGQDGRVVSPRKVRAAAGGVVDLMNQLKGKDESTQGQG